VIHGDIKPQNVLVFKDDTGKTTVKVADFGYSTLVAGENFVIGETPAAGRKSDGGLAARVFLPKSRPWNAPEHHFGEFTAAEAKKADAYSFGMLCLWVLFGSVRIADNDTEYTFDPPTGPHSSLERLKYEGGVEDIAIESIKSIPGLDAECKICLKEFFSLTVALNPQKRASNLGKLLGFINKQR